MKAVVAGLTLLLAGCAAHRPSTWTDPRYPMLFPEQFRRLEPEFAALFEEYDLRLARAGEFGRPLGEQADLLMFFRGRMGPPRPREGFPWRAVPPPPADDPYWLVAEISREIRRDPDNATGYELRANLLESLGWYALAERDRDRAKILRGEIAPTG